jgi:hypothetical protein
MRSARIAALSITCGCAFPDYNFSATKTDSQVAVDTTVADTNVSIDSTLDDTMETAPTVIDTAIETMATDTAVIDTAMMDTAVVDTATPMDTSVTLTLASRGGTWRYLDDGTAPPSSSWRGSSFFDDSKWKTGLAQLGFGDGDEKTIMTKGVAIDAGPDAPEGAPTFMNYVTYYFRRTFTVTDAAGFDELTIKLLRDDGAIVYLNGSEVVRSNMPSGSITNTTFASTTVNDPEEDTFYTFVIPAASLREGSNTIAVEVHQSTSTSSDISFDLELTGHRP